MITNKQIRLIHIARKQLSLTESDYRALLERHECQSAAQLTPRSFSALLADFELLGFIRADKPLHIRRGMATPAQLALVEALWEKWSGADDAEARRHWLERSFKISALRFMTTDHAAMAINALRQMIRRKEFQAKHGLAEPRRSGGPLAGKN